VGRWLTAVLLAALALWGAQFTLRAAPLSIQGPLPGPNALGPFEDDPPIGAPEEWATRRAPLLRTAFKCLVYGEAPAATRPQVETRRLVDSAAFGGRASIEEVSLRMRGARGETAFVLVLVVPNALGAPAPLVIAPNFCGNPVALGERYGRLRQPTWMAPRCKTAAGRGLARALHGADILRPPFADLVRAGYAVMTFSPAEIAPDDPVLARKAFTDLPDATPDRLGAVGAWAWGLSRVIDVAAQEPAIDPSRIAVFGHSRYGKAALWAAATDPRIALVVANQSGRLGASPTSSMSGERLEQLFHRFPYWFPPATKTKSRSERIDQHLLLALIAPRPILLTGATLDRWSDPAGAFRAAEAASPVYRLLGRKGLDQIDMRATNFHADIAFFLRPGGHGIRSADWTAARSFLDAHFK
jgi:hypothetical protein